MKKTLCTCLLWSATMVLASCGGGESSDTGSKSDPSDRYQVSDTYWKSNITQFGLFGKNNNLTLNLEAKVGDVVTTSGIAENGNGKVHLTLNEEGNGLEAYVNTLDDGSYDYYLKDETGRWEKRNLNSASASLIMNSYTNFIHPWTLDGFTYDVTAHAYKKASDSIVIGDGELASISDIVITFEDDKFMSLSYGMTVQGESSNVSVSASKWGSTSVTLPEAEVITSEGSKDTSETSITETSQEQTTTEERTSSDVIAVSSIRLDVEKIALNIGEEHQLVATVLPENASDKSITWTSSNPQIASVDNGKITALDSGETTITATAGGKSATCLVHVNEAGTAIDNPLVGVTLKYIANSASELAFNYTDPLYNKDKLEADMASVTISMFDDGITPPGKLPGEVEKDASFEMISKDADGKIKYVYLGTYTAEIADYANHIELNAYYDGGTGKWYHGEHMATPKQVAFSINGGFIYEDKTDTYYMSSYMMGVNGVVAKGMFAFEKVNDNPVHVEVPEDPHDDNYEETLQNKVYRFNNAKMSDQTTDPKPYADAYATSFISVFEDNYMEHYYDYQIGGAQIQPTQLLWRGYYEVSPVSDDLWTILYRPYEVVKDGETVSTLGSTLTFQYDVKNDVFLYSRNVGKELAVTISFSLASGETPAPYTPAIPDKWDETSVAAAFTAIGVDGSLPKYENAKTFALKMDGTSGFEITLTTSAKSSSKKAYNDYLTGLQSEGDFVMMTDASSIFYLSANAQFELRTNLDTTGKDYKITLSVTKHVVAYPEASIASYMTNMGFTDTLIDLQADGVTKYSFSSSGGSLLADFVAKKAAEDAISAYIQRAINAEYTKKTYKDGGELYLSPNKNFALGFALDVDDSNTYHVRVVIKDCATLPMKTYPSDKVAAALTGVTDSYISFSNDSVDEYTFSEPTAYSPFSELYLSLDGGAAVGQGFIQALEDLGYHKATSMTVGIDAGEAGVRERTFTDYYVSPNEEAAFYIWGADKTSDYPGYVRVSIANLKTFASVSFVGEHWPEEGPQTQAELTNIQVSGYTASYKVDDTFAFDGVVTAIFSDNSTKVLSAEEYSIVVTPSMSSAGTKYCVISYTYNGVTKTARISIVVESNEPQLKTLRYTNVDEVDIYDGFATFGVWAWGGEYGDGAWAEVAPNKETNVFTIFLYENATGFKIVRLNPAYNVSDETWVWNETTVWGETGDMTLADYSAGNQTFRFYY